MSTNYDNDDDNDDDDDDDNDDDDDDDDDDDNKSCIDDNDNDDTDWKITTINMLAKYLANIFGMEVTYRTYVLFVEQCHMSPHAYF
jgi:hypothetical protein